MIDLKSDQRSDGFLKNQSELSLLGKKWIFKDENIRDILGLVQKYGYPELLARLINQRCPQETDPKLFLSPKLKDFLPDPFSLKDMD